SSSSARDLPPPNADGDDPGTKDVHGEGPRMLPRGRVALPLDDPPRTEKPGTRQTSIPPETPPISTPPANSGAKTPSLFRNTVGTSVARLSSSALSLILAPILLTQLGLESFGVWAVVGALATYAGLSDLGIT